MVKYVYDAWGNHEIRDIQGKILEHKENDEENNKLYAIANLNPFRYRGYYYDTETKLYYLKTRYYDPEVGSFITIDDLSYLDPEHINGLNLYAYCGNNPIMNVDYTGNGFVSWIEENIIDPVKHFFTETIPNAVEQAVGWIAIGALAIVSLGLIAIGTFFTGGLLACALIGFGAFALVGMGASIYMQGGFANADPWKVFGTGLASGIAGAIVGGMIGAMSIGGGAYALAQGGALVMTSVQTRVALAGMALGLTILFARTGKSNGYWGEKWSGDHSPDHAHLKGEDGTNIRIDIDGNPLDGKLLKPQVRKAIKKLLKEIRKLFGR